MPVLERAGGSLHYDVCDAAPPWESGETVLFLHGLAIDSGIWATWLPSLVDRYRVVRADLRGFGRSFVPAPGAAWSLGRLAGDVLDVMDALGLERVHFVGESTGGTVGLHLAAEHPERLRSLTTVSAAHRGGSIRLAQALREEVETLGMDAWSEKLMELRFPPGRLSPAMHRWFHDTQRRSDPGACVDLVDMLVACDLTERLPSIAVPTLILAPDASPFVSLESQLERLRAMPRARLAVVPHARHGVAHSHGPECADILRRFLDDLDAEVVTE